MTDFYDYYNNRPPKVNTVLTDDTTFVSQSECQNSSLKYVLDRFGMNTLTARMEEMRGKFGYADCTVSNDFATLQNRYVQAKSYFENLPSNVRRMYHDNPLEFYDNIAENPKKALDEGFISKEKFEEITGNRLGEERVFNVQLDDQSLESPTQYVVNTKDNINGTPTVEYVSGNDRNGLNSKTVNQSLLQQSAPRSLD